MTSPKIRAIVILDYILIMMAATWIIASLSKGNSNFELWYDIIFITLSIITLLLNLSVLKEK